MGIALLALTGLTGGITDPEKVMPVVLNRFLPMGLRGLVTAGLLAAFMSTFAATVNSGASFVVRDLVTPFWRGSLTDRQAVRLSYLATMVLVLCGLTMGLLVESIAQIWNWIMMVLGGSVVIPNVLRWYWWRLNGWGYGVGMLGGILLSAAAPLISGSILVQFPLVMIGSLVFCFAGTYLTAPTRREVLEEFYRSVRPFGLWQPVREGMERLPDRGGSPTGTVLLNVFLGMIAIFCLYVAPMYLVGHWYGAAAIGAIIALACMAVLKFTWYDRLGDGDGDG
jgi:Na+/proline symporter